MPKGKVTAAQRQDASDPDSKMFESVFDQYFKYKQKETLDRLSSKPNEEDEKAQKLRSFILYMAVQEVARQVSNLNKDLGFILLKIFKKYFEENERKWLKLIEKCKVTIDTLK